MMRTKLTRSPVAAPAPPDPRADYAELIRIFRRNGYLRRPDETRQRWEGHRLYKKGWEVRLVAHDEVELARLRSLLIQAGFTPARAHRKHLSVRLIQPIYGREAVERFLKLVLP